MGFRSGEIISQTHFFIGIAGLSIGVKAALPEMKLQVDGIMRRFVVEETEPNVRVWVGWGDLAKKSQSVKLFDSGALWQVYREKGGHLFRFSSPSLGSIPYKVAYFLQDFSGGRVLLHSSYFPPDQPVYPLEYPLDELLISHLLATGLGAEVHAFGLVDDRGDGHLFLGQSGSGKSTMGQLWQDQPGTRALSDDRIILREQADEFWMYGTPWHGDSKQAVPGRARLKRIYVLQKGLQNELIPLTKAEASGRLLACSFFPFYRQEAVGFTVRFFEKLVYSIPCYELRFRPDYGVVEFIRNVRLERLETKLRKGGE